ncbi:Crp/Fnr family transcriptional regulator [Actinophytocola sp.]|uniref:Crp/Fnr family transcriptional regulator n=1 Tax=Actinophytocola sp. TaxID=1872138 RepID=UPI003D6C2689
MLRNPKGQGDWTLTEDEIFYLESVGTTLRRQAGHVFMREGEDGDFVLLIKKGHVQIIAGKPPRIIAFRGPGETVGEMSIILGEPRTATVIAWEDVEVVHISAAELDRFLQDNRRAERALLITNIKRLAQATKMITDSDLAVERRVAKALVDLVERGLTKDADGASSVRMSQPDLASPTGASLVAVKKVVRVFKQHQLIDTGRQLLEIRDVTTLREIATGKPMASW